jgi:glyoxylase-like metal-dependent hydrolase (beta-lactamase superfamily II)
VSRPRREEQEPASEEIVEVSPGILRLQIPISFTGLGHVNSYVFLDDRGAAVVDAGMPGRETWAAILTRLEAAGLQVSDVHTVLVTHSHPDHFGAAGRLAHEAGAELVAHRRFHTWLEQPPQQLAPPHNHLHADAEGLADLSDGQPEEDDTGYFAVLRRRQTPWGGRPFRPTRRQRLTRSLARRNLVPSMRAPIPSRRVVGGEELRLAGRPWRIVHTPGHTGDHLCLYDPEGELLVSGDHVLPTITPHVGGLSPMPDPLGSFLNSLARLIDLGPVSTVLPAHGHPFEGVGTRIEQIVSHHDGRLAALRHIGGVVGEATVVELCHELFREPLWGPMAESETYAHLEFLRLRGDAERVERPDGQLAYRVDPGGTSSASEAAFGEEPR